jgi:hypothetical protein
MAKDGSSARRGGSDWSQAEVDACAAVYLDMLAMEIAGQPYSKAEFNRRVQGETGRTKGSIEFKFQNVSP